MCKKCDENYFLTNAYQCLPIPANCLEVGENGVCSKCKPAYELNAKGECVLIEVTIPDDEESTKCDKDDHKDCDHEE